jgi:transglutaminase-like putative cysteine protease
MIYRLHHATTYDYTYPVVLGTHFMHLLPRNRPGQFIREHNLTISPQPDNRRNEIDHFGNRTTTVSVTQPHKKFVVELSATVDVEQPAPIPRNSACPARSPPQIQTSPPTQNQASRAASPSSPAFWTSTGGSLQT